MRIFAFISLTLFMVNYGFSASDPAMFTSPTSFFSIVNLLFLVLQVVAACYYSFFKENSDRTIAILISIPFSQMMLPVLTAMF